MEAPLPPSKSHFWEPSQKSGSDTASRAWRGVLAIAPCLGVLAAVATVEVMTEKKRPFNWHTATIGGARGFLYWLPFGSAAALYYGGELSVRPYAAALSPWLKSRLPEVLHAVVHAEAQPGALDDEIPSSGLSKVLAGGATGLVISVPLCLAGVRGFRSLGSVPFTTLLAGAAAAAMPDFEAISRR